MRRIIFYGFFVLGIILYMYASLEPVVLVEIYNLFEDNGSFAQRHAQSLLTEKERQIIKDERLADVRAQTIEIKSNEWEEIYKNLLALQNQRSLSSKNWDIADNWKRRLPSDQYPSKVFFFKTSEQPISSFSNYLKHDNEQVYLYLDSINGYLRLQYRIYSDDDFHLGSGFSNLPRPPTWLLYPYRKYSFIIFTLGLLAYIFLPYRLISKDALRYSRWRVIAGDFAVFLLIGVFFSMPLFIVGGTIQAITVGTPITIIMWLISLLGFYSIKISSWYASYQILPMDDGIKIATYKGVNLFRYDEMEYFQPVIFKPPKWLIVLTWLAALSGRGMVGRAILTSVSETGSIGIRLKNGKDLFVVVTDQMGTTAIKGFEGIIERMRSLGVKELDDVREIRSMGFE
ncbi:MAG: hypothetical protein N2511_06665, partial [Thermodesulfovibrionales bacterium]|nr:hypothetical protein [Thermodesulfovibrionales bacterium]